MNKVELRVMRLPHAGDLPLPAYQSEHAAGLDLLAAVPAGAPIVIAPGGRAAIPTGLAVALPPGVEGQIPAAVRARVTSRDHRAQFARHGGCRLSR